MKSAITRRNLIAGTGLAAASAAAVCNVALADETPQAVNFGGTWDKSVDIVICGLGYGGLFAAATAAQGGASCLAVEACKRVGGTGLAAAYGFGFYTSTTADEIINTFPTANAEFVRPMLDGWDDLKQWLTDSDVPWGTNDWLPGYICIEPFNREGNFAMADALLANYEANGGETMLNSKVNKLYVDADGRVCGVRILDADGATVNVAAKAVILATGGFIRNRALDQQFIGTDNVIAEALPTVDGAGLLMAQQVGAQLSADLEVTSGYDVAPYPVDLIDWDTALNSPADMQSCVSDILEGGISSYSGIIVNVQGKRFADETGAGFSDALAKQDYGLGYWVIDQAIRDESIGSMNAEIGDNIDILESKGYKVFKGETLEELAAAMADTSHINQESWSHNRFEVDADAFLATVAEFNEAVEAGTAAQLPVPHTYGGDKIEVGPFYAVRCQKGCYTTNGGVKINTAGEVLGVADVPIEGLYATFGVAGGLIGKDNWTVLTGHVFYGRVAAQSALAAIGK